MAASARTLYNLLSQLPKPSANKEQTPLAHELVDEAFDGLSALIALLESNQVHTPLACLSPTSGRSASASWRVMPFSELEADLDMLTADISIVVSPAPSADLLPSGALRVRNPCSWRGGRLEEMPQWIWPRGGAARRSVVYDQMEELSAMRESRINGLCYRIVSCM